MARRFFIDAVLSPQAEAYMPYDQYADELKHMMRVLRLNPGDSVVLANSERQEAEAKIISLDKSGARLFLSQVKSIPEPTHTLHLVQAVIKGPRMDWLVEKLTELGVSSLTPLLSERVNALEAQEDASKRSERWKRISLSALKQSGSGSPLVLAPVHSLEQASLKASDGLGVFFSLKDGTPPLGICLQQCKQSFTKNIYLFIGPEGGFSEQEEKYLETQGFLAANLGSTILRAETAGIVACALVRDWIDFYSR